MTKSIKIYIGILLLLFVGIVAIEFSKPKPINWSKTYNETHKSPYGTYIFYNELEHLFPESEVNDLAVTPYEYFIDRYNYEDENYDIHGTYMYIDEAMNIDDVSFEELLDFAYYGNTVFISSSNFPEILSDSLKFEPDIDYSFKGEADFRLANKTFKGDSIHLARGMTNVYFSKLDSTNTTVLGYQKFGEEEKINFVKIKQGSGALLLHLQPVVFTNYNLLKKNNKKYTAAILSYLSDDPIYFDSRNKKRYGLSSSPLRFILSQPALRWAWYLALLGIVIFVIFNAKRKQRIVRVIQPLENSTVAFTKTIGNLYYETKDHNNLIDKKITYFLEHIRRVYYLDTQVLDDKFVKNLSLKSGRDFDKTKQLINIIANLKAQQAYYENDLLNLNRAIEDFHNNK